MDFMSSKTTLADSTITSEDRKSDLELGDEDEAFNYDTILEHLGPMGKFQLLTFLCLCVPAFFPGIVLMSYTFTGSVPNYRCYIEGCDDLLASSSETNLFTPDWLNNTIPLNGKNSLDQCYSYNYTFTNVNECQEQRNLTNLNITKKCDRWIYDQSMFQSTIVTEFNLTCDDEWKQTFASTVYMFGMLVGAAVLGYIADAIGRRLSFTLNVFVMATVTTALAFSPNFATFCVLRFFSGVTAVGHFLIVFVWGVEAVGKKYRVMVGFVYELIFAVGAAFLGLLAFYVREWKTLQLIISTPMFALVGIYWIIPESIRWLISKKRYDEARQLILKVSKINKKTVPKHLIQLPDENCNKVTGISIIEEIISRKPLGLPGRDKDNNTNIQTNNQKTESIIDVLRSFILLKRLVIMSFAWTATLMGYLGITFSTTHLSENFFLNYELSMIMEFPACIAGIFMMSKLGCRPTLSGGLILCGFTCLITGIVPEDYTTTRVVFSMIGKLLISCVMATVSLYTSDLFPTSVRGVAIGLCSTCGRIGGILAPIIANAGRKIDPAMPFIIFAIVNICIGMLCLLLPETNNRTLPATVKEAEDLEKYTFPCLRCRTTSKKITEKPVIA